MKITTLVNGVVIKHTKPLKGNGSTFTKPFAGTMIINGTSFKKRKITIQWNHIVSTEE